MGRRDLPTFAGAPGRVNRCCTCGVGEGVGCEGVGCGGCGSGVGGIGGVGNGVGGGVIGGAGGCSEILAV